MRDVALSGLDSCLFQRQVIETTLEPHPELTTHVECIIYNIASLSHRLAVALCYCQCCSEVHGDRVLVLQDHLNDRDSK